MPITVTEIRTVGGRDWRVRRGKGIVLYSKDHQVTIMQL